MNKEYYVAHLKQYKVADLRMYLEIICNTLLGDMDFSLALQEDDLCEVLEKEIPGIKGKAKKLFSEETIDLYRRLQEYCFSEENLKKVETRELLAEALSDDAVAEALWLCLATSESEEDAFAADLGATEDLERLRADETFRMRRSFMEMIRRYAEAAVNLYGTVLIVELEEIIRFYHKSFESAEKYRRAGGAYPETIFLTPEYLSTSVLQYIVGNAVPQVQQTLDGIVMNKCFADAYRTEIDEFTEYLKQLTDEGADIDDETMGRFQKERTYPYRRLLDIAEKRMLYVPSGEEEFLHYADADADDCWKTEAQEQLQKLLAAKNALADADAGALMVELRETLWDHNEKADAWKKDVSVRSAMELLAAKGITAKTEDERQKLEDALAAMTDHMRLWTLHANTAAEDPGNLSMKNSGITILPEKQETITKPKKIYPNDPCPCGSGKKYKKCCGRR